MHLILMICNFSRSFTSISTILGVFVGLSEEYRGILGTLLIVTAVVYICALYYYSENQKSLDDLEKRIAASENKRKSFECMMQELQAVCTNNAGIIHKYINEPLTVNIDTLWSFDDFTKICCKSLYKVLMNMQLPGKNYAVSYIRKVDAKHIKLVGYANRNDRCPNVYNVERDISLEGYYDAQLFYYANPDCHILHESDLIKERFKYEKNCKYEQYVGIPVVDSNGEMVGLLQISAIDGSKIGDDKEIINDIVVSYFIPFVSVLLLFYEIDLYLHKD